MKRIYQFLIVLFTFLFGMMAYGAENILYVLHSSPKHPEALQFTLNNVKQHAKQINVVISQAYQIDGSGNLSGYLNNELVQLTRAEHLKLMAMITNTGFDQPQIHQFLKSAAAQQKAIQSIILACKENHLYGVQFDFEMVSVNDKASLTNFFFEAANKLHQSGFAVSYAVVPIFSKNSSVFLRKTYENWSGAYDLKALSHSADFITVMAYNQHPDGTVPGPNASMPWVETAIKNSLNFVAANKLSLGIPAYSLYWYTGTPNAHSQRISTQRLEIGYNEAKKTHRKKPFENYLG